MYLEKLYRILKIMTKNFKIMMHQVATRAIERGVSVEI